MWISVRLSGAQQVSYAQACAERVFERLHLGASHLCTVATGLRVCVL